MSAWWFLFLFAVGGSISASGLKTKIPEISGSRQLIVVIAKSWGATGATVCCYERADAAGPWRPAFPGWGAVIGRRGMAWGIGLHGTAPAGELVKREGDECAPAGVFKLREIFGYATAAKAGITKFPYVRITETYEGIDDSHSRYYNRVVDAALVKDKDWKTSEIMSRPRELYRWGVVVEHNWNQTPGNGSCIFLHIWPGDGRGTSGCTAMPAARIVELIRWLDESKRPLLVQLPVAEYERLKPGWGLP